VVAGNRGKNGTNKETYDRRDEIGLLVNIDFIVCRIVAFIDCMQTVWTKLRVSVFFWSKNPSAQIAFHSRSPLSCEGGLYHKYSDDPAQASHFLLQPRFARFFSPF
jgi:hypothetical protein